MITRIIALLILVALILTMQWLWFQAREIAPGIVSRPVGECYMDWYSQRVTLVLPCPRHDLIRLWPWPVIQPCRRIPDIQKDFYRVTLAL